MKNKKLIFPKNVVFVTWLMSRSQRRALHQIAFTPGVLQQRGLTTNQVAQTDVSYKAEIWPIALASIDTLRGRPAIYPDTQALRISETEKPLPDPNVFCKCCYTRYCCFSLLGLDNG